MNCQLKCNCCHLRYIISYSFSLQKESWSKYYSMVRYHSCIDCCFLNLLLILGNINVTIQWGYNNQLRTAEPTNGTHTTYCKPQPNPIIGFKSIWNIIIFNFKSVERYSLLLIQMESIFRNIIHKLFNRYNSTYYNIPVYELWFLQRLSTYGLGGGLVN